MFKGSQRALILRRSDDILLCLLRRALCVYFRLEHPIKVLCQFHPHLAGKALTALYNIRSQERSHLRGQTCIIHGHDLSPFVLINEHTSMQGFYRIVSKRDVMDSLRVHAKVVMDVGSSRRPRRRFRVNLAPGTAQGAIHLTCFACTLLFKSMQITSAKKFRTINLTNLQIRLIDACPPTMYNPFDHPRRGLD